MFVIVLFFVVQLKVVVSNRVEPRFNEPLYNEVPDKMNNITQP